MFVDQQLRVSDSQAITVTARSANVIDTGIKRDLGIGRQMYFVVTVTTAFTAAGAATLTITLETASDAPFTTPVVLWSSSAIGKATLVAGFVLLIPVPPMPSYASVAYDRFLSLNYTVATGPMTAGVLIADLVLDMQDFKAYAGNYSTAS
jgi:hypothetical protein